MFGFNHLVVVVDKSQQSESNSSSFKTHKSQESCLMSLNIDKSPGAKPDGLDLVLFKLRMGAYLRSGLVCGVMVLIYEIHLNLTLLTIFN